jgi:hypothetical protein
MAVAAAVAVAGLGATTAARAELVSYDFTATISQADAKEVGAIGLPTTGTISGSFSYDTDKGWYGGSNTWADPTLQLTIDQVSEDASWSTWMAVEYNQQTLTVAEDAKSSGVNYWARLLLTGQPDVTAQDNGALPTSLTLDGAAGGTLTLYLSQDFNSGDADLVATLQTLTPSGTSPVSTPELDPRSGAGALALMIGAVGVVLGRRRRSAAV